MKITERMMLDWLIRRSDPIELFGLDGVGTWWTEQEMLKKWRDAIRKEIREGGVD